MWDLRAIDRIVKEIYEIRTKCDIKEGKGDAADTLRPAFNSGRALPQLSLPQAWAVSARAVGRR